MCERDGCSASHRLDSFSTMLPDNHCPRRPFRPLKELLLLQAGENRPQDPLDALVEATFGRVEW